MKSKVILAAVCAVVLVAAVATCDDSADEKAAVHAEYVRVAAARTEYMRAAAAYVTATTNDILAVGGPPDAADAATLDAAEALVDTACAAAWTAVEVFNADDYLAAITAGTSDAALDAAYVACMDAYVAASDAERAERNAYKAAAK